MPGIGSGAVGAGNSDGSRFDALPQLVADGEGSTRAQQRQRGRGRSQGPGTRVATAHKEDFSILVLSSML